MEYLSILRVIFTSAGLLKGIIKQILFVKEIIKISKFLLHQNEFVDGIGRAKHFADRFIACWKSPEGIISNNELYPTAYNHPRWVLSFIDKSLEEKGLVKIKGGKAFAIKNNRNTVIIKILKFYQIKISGHSQDDYTNMSL
jgi:glycerol-3-phosphate responsive antiterminator